MTQAERRIYLIKELLKENGGALGKVFGLAQSDDGGYEIPYTVGCPLYRSVFLKAHLSA